MAGEMKKIDAGIRPKQKMRSINLANVYSIYLHKDYVKISQTEKSQVTSQIAVDTCIGLNIIMARGLSFRNSDVFHISLRKNILKVVAESMSAFFSRAIIHQDFFRDFPP